MLSFFNLIMCILANDILKIWVEYIKISCSGDIAFLRNIFQFPFFYFLNAPNKVKGAKLIISLFETSFSEYGESLTVTQVLASSQILYNVLS